MASRPLDSRGNDVPAWEAPLSSWAGSKSAKIPQNAPHSQDCQHIEGTTTWPSSEYQLANLKAQAERSPPKTTWRVSSALFEKQPHLVAMSGIPVSSSKMISSPL